MTLTITNQAAERIKKLLSSEPEGSFLRIAIQNGGCAGFQYNITIDHLKTQDDVFFSHLDAPVVIDDVSLSLFQDGTLDYIDDMVASKFILINPNATAGCGCGNSFAI